MAMVAWRARQKNVDAVIPEDENKQLLFPKGQGKRSLQKYIKDMSVRARPPDYRNSNRTAKTWAIPPPNYAPIESNQGVGLAAKVRDSGWNESTDIAGDIISEILRFGRQTIDEVRNHIQGYDEHLVTIIINALIQDDYLTIIEKDEDGTRNTLELVDENKRNRMIESRFVKRMELEHPEWKEVRLLQEELPPANAMAEIPRFIDVEAGEIDYDLNAVEEEKSEEEELREYAQNIEIIRPSEEGEYEVEIEDHVIRKRRNSLKIQDTD